MKSIFKVHVQPHVLEEERSISHKIINLLVILLFIFVVGSSLLFVLAKDSVPTDSLYPVKGFGEKILLNVFALNQNVSIEFQFSLLEQRYNESRILLTKNESTSGFPMLNTQAEELEKFLFALELSSYRYKALSRFADSLVRYEDGFEKNKIEVIAKRGGDARSVLDIISMIDDEKSELSSIKEEVDSELNIKK